LEAGLCLPEAPAHFRAAVNPLPSIKGKVLTRDTAAAGSQLLLSSQLSRGWIINPLQEAT